MMELICGFVCSSMALYAQILLSSEKKKRSDKMTSYDLPWFREEGCQKRANCYTCTKCKGHCGNRNHDRTGPKVVENRDIVKKIKVGKIEIDEIGPILGRRCVFCDTGKIFPTPNTAGCTCDKCGQFYTRGMLEAMS